jgi:hypothetical protein
MLVTVPAVIGIFDEMVMLLESKIVTVTVPEPKDPVPEIAATIALFVIPVVEDIPLTTAVYGPLPLTEPMVPVVDMIFDGIIPPPVGMATGGPKELIEYVGVVA